MNLFFLASKRDKNLVITESAVSAVRRYGDDSWRGFDISPSDTPQIRIRNATQWYPFRDRPESIGWYATAREQRGSIALSFVDPGGVAANSGAALVVDHALSPVRMPWTLNRTSHASEQDLLIHVPSDSPGPVFLGIHHALDRKSTWKLCKGVGVEIGPGPKPQILPASDVAVSYIEQMPAADWRRLYAPKAKGEFDDSVWDRYIVGDAHRLPFEDGSLDFIYCSHVFEHLANPLGHLEIWGSKLRKGGVIVAVLPDLSGAKDYAAYPSDLREWIAEYESGELAPTRAHYERFAHLRGMKDGGQKIWETKWSIHVHFYTSANMAMLLREAIGRFNFQDFSIVHTPNHKDFYFSVVR